MVKGKIPKTLDLSIPEERERALRALLAVKAMSETAKLAKVLRQNPRPHGTFAKSQLLGAYRQFVQEGVLDKDVKLEQRLRGRPVRTISGVAPVAVLTEPYACPGECIFCPEQENAPKSYLDGEPGVLRAIQNKYDPYEQTHVRIRSLEALGHDTSKIELLILGGTWSYYPDEYRKWFLRRCFDAMNEREFPTLRQAIAYNETAKHRNVGLVIETRPDWITPEEIVRLREEGVTKIQLGAQSFDDEILRLNRRGHTLADVQRAMDLLRLAGFKTVLHWMPNLFGATPESDLIDFARLWTDDGLKPDEMKIYPTVLLKNTQLYDLWQAGHYQPYEEEALIALLIACKQTIPPYSRINRLMRDIPAYYIVAGTTKSNLRQIVQQRMTKQAQTCQCIRCREIRGKESVNAVAITLSVISYATHSTQEHFLQYVTSQGRLAGFLRLSLPKSPRNDILIPEIAEVAMIRELHIYGPALALGQQGRGGQHQGLGSQLLEHAATLAREAGFSQLAVIAAVGTRPYYRTRGFTQGVLYPIKTL